MTPDISRFKRTKAACYYTYVAMSSIFALPPILFVTFRDMYGISYTLLGTLVLINFCTQLCIDLIFSFFPQRFNIKQTVRFMPLITAAGLCVYAIVPTLIPQYAYGGLVVGTFIFSVAAGLNEVLLSPTVAALPSDDHERDMSTLHSLYAYGVLIVVGISTVFLRIFGRENWMYLTMFFAALPVVSFIMFTTSPMPDINISEKPSTAANAKKRTVGIALCFACIFMGGATENAMTNWISGYLEVSLGISKALGDILGMALFAVLLGLGRTWYAKYGKNVINVILFGMIGSIVCYTAAALVTVPVIAAAASVFVGLCTSMLWPGTLILLEEKIPHPGVTAYALMAAGGDLGSSIAPQLLGAVTDIVSSSNSAQRTALSLGISAEQIGMRAGMMVSVIFPIIGLIIVLIMKKFFINKKKVG